MNLIQINEVSDSYFDALVLDESHNLLFLSMLTQLYSLQEFRARLSLGASTGGISSLSFYYNDDVIKANLLDLNLNLESMSMPKSSIVNGIHTFFYDASLNEKLSCGKSSSTYLICKANESEEVVRSKLWDKVVYTATPPLQREWMDLVVSSFIERKWIRRLPSYGIQAFIIDLPDEHIELIEMLINSGQLTLSKEVA